jgi:predicted nucleic acid-binding protein
MENSLFYVDACIWLNLFKKEGDKTKGKPYWKIANDFIYFIWKSGFLIIVSPFVLREVESKLNHKYGMAKDFFDKENYIKPIKAIQEDYLLARKLESLFSYNLSFYDCLHVAICNRIGATLVTRDRDLLKFSRPYAAAKKPEHLIS